MKKNNILLIAHRGDTSQRQKDLAKFKKWQIDQCTIDNANLARKA